MTESAARLVAGNVVRWRNGPGAGLGVVEHTDEEGRRIHVRFDDGSEQTFRWPIDVIDRVLYEPGRQVQGVVDGSPGIVTGHLVHDGVALYQVSQPGGALKVITEASLRPAVLTDPTALIAAGQIHDGRSTNLRIAATRLLFAHQFEELSSLSNSRVEIKPHQVSVLHRVATSYPHRFLLADEVGLGKTVEAGLIIKELKARGVAERVLILAPSGIVSQWQYELKSKFNEVFSRYTRDTVSYLEANHPGENVWAINNNVIASTTYASWDERRRKDVALAGWDLVVIDEAHHARRTYEAANKSTETQLYKLASSLADSEHGRPIGFLLLTATPMQLHPFELYSLIELLDPTLFPDYGEFDAHRSALAGLNRTFERVLEWPRLRVAEQDEARSDAARWLGTRVEDLAEKLATAAGREEIADDLRARHRLSEVMIRNRKARIGGFRGRTALVIPVELTPEERAAYDAASAYAQRGYRRSRDTGNNALGFLMAIFQKLNSSSSEALRQSLLRRLERLQEQRPTEDAELPDEEELSESRLGEGGDWLALENDVEHMKEVLELQQLVKMLSAIGVDSKAQALKRQLDDIRTTEPGPRVIIFTQFRDTQAYLDRVLRGTWSVNVFHGQLSPEDKDRAVQRFRDGTGPQLLISTEAGGEGRNFQFCHMLVNYDLPWNPMKIEQRIGRLDRIGQQHTVKIFNLSLVGTIEERVLEVLTERIRLFEETIGGLDPILGDAIEYDLRAVFMDADEESERALKQLELQLDDRVRQARAVEVRLADLIMDTRSFRHEEVEQLLERRSAVGPEMMSRFVLAALRELGVEWAEDEDVERAYRIRFHGRSLVELERFVQEGRTWRVTFDPRVALAHEELDFLAFGHPLVDELAARVTARDYGGRTSHRIVLSDRFPSQEGWFFTFALEFEGVIRSKEVLPVYITVDGRVDTEVADWLFTRSTELKRDASPTNTLPDLASFPAATFLAGEAAIRRLLERKAELAEANRDRLRQEREKLERFYEYKERAARDKLASVERVYGNLLTAESPEERRILPVWAKNAENARRRVELLGSERDRRLRDLLGRDEVSASHEMLTASYVEVMARDT